METANRVRVLDKSMFRRIAVAGDIHGDIASLRALLGKVDLESDALVFLGDYADRGRNGIEVIDTVDGLIQKYKSVTAVRGNHEDYDRDGEPSFSPCDLQDEAREKRGSWMEYFNKTFKPFSEYFNKTFKPFSERLYLAAILPGEALFVHGGVSGRMTDLERMRWYEEHVLWSDPVDWVGERRSRRGAGIEFGSDVSESVCKSLGVKRIIRSHEPRKAPNGPYAEHDGRVITTSCTSVYGGRPSVLFIETGSGKLYSELL